MHSFAAAAAFTEKQRRGEKQNMGIKHIYTQHVYMWKHGYLTFQFNLYDTWLSREVQRERVCVFVCVCVYVCVPLRC